MSNREHNSDAEGLDALLTAHLRGALDDQLGRAEARFRAEVMARPRRSRPMRLGVWGLWVAWAMAASVGIVWGVAVRHGGLEKARIADVGGGGPSVSAEVEPTMVGEVTEYQTIDEGAVVVNDAGAARRVRREVVQTLQWHDPQTGAEIEVTIPHEQVVYVGMPAF